MANHVYLVRAGKSEYKVGVTSNVSKRIKALQTSNAKKIELITAKQIADAYKAEKSIHEKLQSYILDGGREWFSLRPTQVIKLCILINQLPAVVFTEIEELERLVISTSEQQEQMVITMRSLLEQAKNELKPKQPIIKVLPPPKVDREIIRNDTLELDIQDALNIFNKGSRVSTSALQLNLRFGYGRAARVMSTLEKRGLITKQDGNRPRQLVEQSAILPTN